MAISGERCQRSGGPNERMSETSPLSYRADIDGLRAVAVLGVLAYHAFPKMVTGGFSGVDVFFVISGFLITSIIVKEIAEQRFSLATFYARRIKRLFPALILVLAATAFFGWFYLLPHEYRALGRHIAAGAAYIINFTLKSESGYFDGDADEKPLLHLWSLAVEEQFYLVWPLILMAVTPRRYLLAVIAAIFFGSLASNMARVGTNGAAAFYLPQNRFWELAMGAMLALAPERLRALPQPASNMLSVAGLALIASGYWGLHARLHYPGAWALIPCMGAMCLIAAGPNAIVNRLLLANPIAVAIGLISYPLYLWHWPLLSFQSILAIDSISARLGALAAAAVLATLTYLLAERPIRHARKPVYAIALFGIAMCFVPLGVLARKEILPPRLAGPAFQDLSAAARDWKFLDDKARIPAPGSADIRKAGSGAHRILFFGDSNVQQYWPRVEKLLGDGSQATVYFATAQGCLPAPGVTEPFHPACNGFAENVERFAESEKIKTIVLAAAWGSYFRDPRYRIGVGAGNSILYGKPGYAKAISAFGDMLARLRAQGADVWLVLSIPVGGTLPPQSSLQRAISGEAVFLPSQLSRAAFEKSWSPIRADIVSAAQAAGVRVIDPVETLCSPDICPGRTASGAFIYKDPSHLRASFAREHATFIDTVFNGTEAGTAPSP